ncbi:MAG TPA: MIP/aquaporin family protein [Candidatus Sulfomarinibacteraceae bacterium]|nr:MIP/aquaporin family protein [Candidatus Sulfomarinibacteraceae bacterium]
MNSVFLGEMFGTMFLMILGDGVVANVLLSKSKGENAGWIVITTGWAFAVMTGVFVSGLFGSPAAHINPAVTVGLAAGGFFPWGDVPIFIVAQVLGAFLGGVIVWLAYYRHWGETDDPGLKLAVFSTGPAIRDPLWNSVTEIIGTFALVLGVIAIFNIADAPTMAGIPVDGLGPFIVGSLVWGIGLSLGGPTGYAINPARDLGPRIAHQILPIPGKGDSDWGYGWVPVVAPLIGGAIAGLIALLAR